MHINCPHCQNPIEVVADGVHEVVCPSCGSSIEQDPDRTNIYLIEKSPRRLGNVGESLWSWTRRNPVVAGLSVAVVATLVGGTMISTYIAVRASVHARDLAEETIRANRLAKTATENAELANTNAERANTKAELANMTAELERKQREPADGNEQEARRELYDIHMRLAQLYWESSQVGLLLDSLEKTRPQPGEADLRGFEWRYLWQRCQGDQLHTLYGHSNAVHCVAFSRDGKLLASGDDAGMIKLWDVAAQGAIATLTASKSRIVRISFSADGKALASADETGLEIGRAHV